MANFPFLRVRRELITICQRKGRTLITGNSEENFCVKVCEGKCSYSSAPTNHSEVISSSILKEIEQLVLGLQ